MTEADKDLLRRFIHLYNEGRPDQFPAVLSRDFVWHGSDGRMLRGLTAHGGEYGPRPTEATGSVMRIEEIICEDDKLCVRLEAVSSDGRVLRRMNDVFRIENGKLAEEWSGHS